MTVFLEKECVIDFSFDPEEIAAKVADAVLDSEGCPYEAQVNVTITDDASIHEINLEQRGIDRATDVLSFPMSQFEVPGDFTFLEEMDFDSFEPDSGELMLGDIVISADHVKSQAEEYGHSELREYAFLVAHSMFHLIGYDHMVPEEAAVMEKKQEAILQTLGITRQ
ncbi:MAG: rRNA maturation RNase YbeY [Eubacteriales bacterium]|nr:rRNA maturation RNase YbeY [Eubacteriales bacterium]